MSTNKARIVGPRDGKAGSLGSIGVRFMIDGTEAGERFSLVEHPLGPRALAAPLHRHHREDEYSFFLQGRMGALLGDEVLEAGVGDLVFKPRAQWHTFLTAMFVQGLIGGGNGKAPNSVKSGASSFG